MDAVNPYETTQRVVDPTDIPAGCVEVDVRELSAALGPVAQVIYGGFMRSRSASGIVRYRVDTLTDKVPKWASARKWGDTDIKPSKRTVQRALARLKSVGLLPTVGRSSRGCAVRRVVGNHSPTRRRHIIVPRSTAAKLQLLPNEPIDVYEDEDMDTEFLDTSDNPPRNYELGEVLPPPERERVEVDESDWVARLTAPRAELTNNAPALFQPGRLVPVDCVYYDDVPSLRIPRASVNLGGHRDVVTEYEHPVLGKYCRQPRTELVWPDLPDVDSSAYTYKGPGYPELDLSQGVPFTIRQMVAAYRAVLHYRTGEKSDAYEDGLRPGEVRCVLAASRKLARHGLKPHVWALHWTRVLMRGKDAWLPKQERPPKITDLFRPAAIDKQHMAASRHRIIVTAYQDRSGGQAMKLLASLKDVIRELRHYTATTQEHLTNLANKRLVEYDALMRRMSVAYRSRYSRDQFRIDEGEWVWANVEKTGDEQ